MVHRPLRPLTPSQAATGLYDDWLAELEDRLADPDTDRNALCREVLRDLYFPGMSSDVDEAQPPASPPAWPSPILTRATSRWSPSTTTRSTRIGTIPRKPLLWLWQMFDRSPLGGNVHLGVRLRRILAPHVFASVGRNFKCFHFVEVSFGYNLEVGDDVVIHRNVLLDDRGGIRLGNHVSISDHASVFSHTHSIDDIRRTSPTLAPCSRTTCE